MSLLLTHNNILLWLQGFFACQMWGVMMVFFYVIVEDVLLITDRIEQMWVFLLWGGGTFVGKLLALVCNKHFNDHTDQHSRCVLHKSFIIGIMPMLAAVAQCVYLLVPMQHGAQLTVMVIAAVLASIPGPLMQGMILQNNTNEVKATACAILEVTDSLGLAAGPLLVAVLLPVLGLKAVTAVLSGAWFLAGVLMCCLK